MPVDAKNIQAIIIRAAFKRMILVKYVEDFHELTTDLTVRFHSL